jgi:hypothetical protein
MAVVSPLQAEVSLLTEVQLTTTQIYVHRGEPLPTQISFFLGLGSASWIQTFTAESVGQTFTAPESLLVPFALRWPDYSPPNFDNSVVYTAGASELPIRLSWIADIPESARSRPLVRIERTIDAVIIEEPNPGRTILHGGTQTIRFYGEAIPEPSAYHLAQLAVNICISLRPSRNS